MGSRKRANIKRYPEKVFWGDRQTVLYPDYSGDYVNVYTCVKIHRPAHQNIKVNFTLW